MTASDIPLTAGQPDNGFEGYRFTGYTIYDALVNWDLSSADAASDIRPGLATEWAVKEGDPTVWTIKLREGVKFHDGSDFNADAVLGYSRASFAAGDRVNVLFADGHIMMMPRDEFLELIGEARHRGVDWRLPGAAGERRRPDF